MSWYRTGTVTVTNGSPNVTLAGGDALQNIFPDDGFVGPDGRTYPILTIGGATSFVLATNYVGPSLAGQPYAIAPTADFTQLRDTLIQVNNLITSYQDFTLKAGIGLFSPGTVASPGVRGIGFEGTGLAWLAGGSLGVSVNGTTVATFNPSIQALPGFLKIGNGGNANTSRLLVNTPNGEAAGIQLYQSGVESWILENVAGGTAFRITASGAERMRITTAGKVGIGTTAPEGMLHITAPNPIFNIQNTLSGTSSTPYGIELGGGGATDGSFRSVSVTGEVRIAAGRNASWGGHLTFYTDTVERMRITPNGNILMGTAANNYLVNMARANPPRGIIAEVVNNAGSALNGAFLNFTQNTIENWSIGQVPGVNAFGIYQGRNAVTDGTNLFYIQSGGNVGIGTSVPATKIHVLSSNVESARFQTSAAIGNSIIGIGDASGRKAFLGYPNAAYALHLMNEEASSLVLGTAGAVRLLIEAPGNMLPGSDNTQNIGSAAIRWAVIYAATGTINTCDVRFKTFRAEPGPTEAEMRAALAAIEVMGFFQWDDSIADPLKGPDGARWHFGPKAQGVWEIFAAEGLCAPLVEDPATGDMLPPEGSIPPAFLCFDKWEQETAPIMEDVEIPAVLGEDGEELEPARTESQPTGEMEITKEAGNIFGVRIDQLHSLMIVALNDARKKQEVRLAALEDLLAV